MQKIKILMRVKEKSDTDTATAREKFINIYFFCLNIFFLLIEQVKFQIPRQIYLKDTYLP